MPFSMGMPIGALNNNAPPTWVIQRLNAPRVPLKQALHAPMISRIFNTPPGCSSCGKR